MARTRDARREWREVTAPYCIEHFPHDRVFGEVPLRGMQRSIDAIVLQRPGRGARAEPIHWQDLPHEERFFWLNQFRGANLITVQTKIERIGLSLLGQTLGSVHLVALAFGAKVTGVGLGTATEPVLADVVSRVPFAGLIRLDTYPGPVVRSKRAYERAPDRLINVTEPGGLLAELTRAASVNITTDETVEALYVRGAREVTRLDDLTGREVALAHTSPRRIGMYLFGHALFSAKVVERYRPSALQTLALPRIDDPGGVGRIAASYGVRVVPEA